MNNREIKFRAYSKSLNKMIYTKFIYPDIDKTCDWEIMEWTGLFDKNNKEIYEGDIVNTKRNRYKIIWNSNLALFDAVPLFYNDKSNTIFSSINSNCFLMGNIFENKDLLPS